MSATYQVAGTEFLVTVFWGGVERGRCIQVSNGDGAIQLTAEQARQLGGIVGAWGNGWVTRDEAGKLIGAPKGWMLVDDSPLPISQSVRERLQAKVSEVFGRRAL